MAKIKGWKKLKSVDKSVIGKYKNPKKDKILSINKFGNVNMVQVLSKSPRGKKYNKVDYTFGAGKKTTQKQIKKKAFDYMKSHS